jgi:hypothetical protein
VQRVWRGSVKFEEVVIAVPKRSPVPGFKTFIISGWIAMDIANG